jgi:magnesium chelatase family protein
VPAPPVEDDDGGDGLDLADVRGQVLARQALEVAAAGGHHLLLVGPPGAGKTTLARRLPGLLPPLGEAQALEVTRIHSAAGLALPPAGLIRRPPFRAPHHSASPVALVGGGSARLRPGEVTLAAHGVLFLDELAEFAPVALDVLRQPLEDGVVRIARARGSVAFPARVLLVAAMNPCPCGEAGRPDACTCGDAARLRYQRRLSGPLLDRFDLRLAVDRPEPSELLGAPPAARTSSAAERVRAARARAAERGVAANAELPSGALDAAAPLTAEARRLLHWALESGKLTARGLDRVRRVALTLADLDGGADVLDLGPVALALQLRADPLAMGARAA